MPVPSAACVVFVVSVGAFSGAELVLVFHRRPGADPAGGRSEAVLRLLLLGGIVMVPLGRAVAPGARIGGGAFPFVLGVAVSWAGALLRWWSVATLGRYFTVVVRTSADQPVTDRGPYRVLRHPSYTGLLLVFAGVGVMAGNLVGAAGAVVLVLIAVVHRVRVEERALVAALGDRYLAYAASRARLVPFVW